MNKRIFLRTLKISKGQTVVEYTLLISIAIAILLAMAPTVKRMSQAMVKVVSDEVGVQAKAEQPGGGSGGLITSDVSTSFNRSQRKIETIPSPGSHQRDIIYHENTTTSTVTNSSQGITPHY